jgi:hypothetical protein
MMPTKRGFPAFSWNVAELDFQSKYFRIPQAVQVLVNEINVDDSSRNIGLSDPLDEPH